REGLRLRAAPLDRCARRGRAAGLPLAVRRAGPDPGGFQRRPAAAGRRDVPRPGTVSRGAGGSMQQETVLQLREIFERCNIILSFNGPISQSLIEELGQAIRNYLEAQTQTRQAVSDVFSVYIELTQNIRHYAATAADEAERLRLNAGTVI